LATGGRPGSSRLGSIVSSGGISTSKNLQPEGLTLSLGEREDFHHEGILPVAKSTKIKGYGWRLPGHGDAYADCGSKRYKGCLNVEAHSQESLLAYSREGLLEKMVGHVFVKIYRRSCARAECPVCYESWAAKEARKIAWRLLAWKNGGRPIHVIVSVPKRLYNLRFDFVEIKRRAYSVLKKTGFLGGSCIFHPFRMNKKLNRWYFSPHFHVIGYGWIHGTKENYNRHGWIVKNARVRKTVFGTAMYQLSHAGIHEGHHTVTWFGRLSYNKLKVFPMPEVEERCPICKQKLQGLWYFGSEDLPEKEGDYWLPSDNWVYKPRRYCG
jgi:hypothetical protein